MTLLTEDGSEGSATWIFLRMQSTFIRLHNYATVDVIDVVVPWSKYIFPKMDYKRCILDVLTVSFPADHVTSIKTGNMTTLKMRE